MQGLGINRDNLRCASSHLSDQAYQKRHRFPGSPLIALDRRRRAAHGLSCEGLLRREIEWEAGVIVFEQGGPWQLRRSG